MRRLLNLLWFRQDRMERDLDRELKYHLDRRVEDLLIAGLSESEARRRAAIEFGGMAQVQEEVRETWVWRWLDHWGRDLRYALRTLKHSPGFTITAVLSLALAIGANTAIFGVFDAIMLRLMPVHEPQQLVFVETVGTAGRDGPPYPLFELIREQATSFEAVAAFSPSAMELTIDRGREQARGVWVSGNFYELLGVRPLIGRGLTSSDDRTGGKAGLDGAVAVISRAYWQERFGSDPAVIGRALYLYGHAVTIVGVMSTQIMSLEPGRPIDIAVPMMLSDPVKMRDRAALWLFVVGRLKPGRSVQEARAEAEALFRAYMADVQVSPGIRTRLFDHMDLAPAAKGLSGLRRRFSNPVTALMILAGFVLLAACVNITNLMLARAMARQRDFAVRLAIGAGRGRLISQSVTEASVLAGAGTLLGILLARVGGSALATFFEGNNAIILDLSLNVRVLLFTLSLGVLSALVVGITPAIRALADDPAAGLRGGSRTVTGARASMRVSRGLVIVQVALSMVLLAGAGLFIRSLRQLQFVDLGFDREGILTMEVAPERHLHGSSEWLAMQSELLERVRQIPGVLSAGWATMNPLSGRDRGAVLEVAGFVPRAEEDKGIHLAAVSPEYFDTLDMPILLGRRFTAHDHGTAPKAAILNETASRFYFGGANPIGRKVRFTNYPSPDLRYEIVGVVKDAIHDNVREPASRFIYLPIAQSVDRINRLALAVRCSGDPISFAAPVRRQIQNMSSTLLTINISTMEEQIEQTLLRERLVATLSAVFGTTALVLSGIGLYGILAYAVTRRTSEIGIRMALGATRSHMVWMILHEAFALAACGISIGIPVAAGLARFAKASLYGVEPLDPLAFASAGLLLVLFAALAAILPGRRATLLDPSIALRSE
jgi:predicted permease